MRTTIKIDDALLAEAKLRAAESGRTLNAVVEEADCGLLRCMHEAFEDGNVRLHARYVLSLMAVQFLNACAMKAVLDVAPGTVMSRLHRSRMALRTELESGND